MYRVQGGESPRESGWLAGSVKQAQGAYFGGRDGRVGLTPTQAKNLQGGRLDGPLGRPVVSDVWIRRVCYHESALKLGGVGEEAGFVHDDALSTPDTQAKGPMYLYKLGVRMTAHAGNLSLAVRSSAAPRSHPVSHTSDPFPPIDITRDFDDNVPPTNQPRHNQSLINSNTRRHDQPLPERLRSR